MQLHASKHISKALSLLRAWQYVIAGTKPDRDSNDRAFLDTELPGGSPFSLCSMSSSADLFDTTSEKFDRTFTLPES
jgi:hypothetical protein